MVIFAVWKLSSPNFCQLDNLQCDCSSTSSEPHFSYIHDGKFVNKNFTRMGQWTHCSLKEIGTCWIGLGNDMMNWVGKFWHETGNQWPLSTNWCSPRAAASCILCAKGMEFSKQETLKKVSPALRVTCMLEMSSMINRHPFWQGCSSKLRKQSSYHTQRFPQIISSLNYLPQIISRAHKVITLKILNGPFWHFPSSLFIITSIWSLNTPRKSFNILKWNVGVSNRLLVFHFVPVLEMILKIYISIEKLVY